MHLSRRVVFSGVRVARSLFVFVFLFFPFFLLATVFLGPRFTAFNVLFGIFKPFLQAINNVGKEETCQSEVQMFLLIKFTHLTSNLDWGWFISTLIHGSRCGLHAWLHWYTKLNQPATFCWSACTNPRNWVVMYICVRFIDFSTVSTIIRLGFVIVSTVWYLVLHYIANDTSEINTSVTWFSVIKQYWDYNNTICVYCWIGIVLRHATLKCAIK